jgi:hypothetical protein
MVVAKMRQHNFFRFIPWYKYTSHSPDQRKVIFKKKFHILVNWQKLLQWTPAGKWCGDPLTASCIVKKITGPVLSLISPCRLHLQLFRIPGFMRSDPGLQESLCFWRPFFVSPWASRGHGVREPCTLVEAIVSGCPASSLPYPSGGHGLQNVLDFGRPWTSGGPGLQEALDFRRPKNSEGPELQEVLGFSRRTLNPLFSSQRACLYASSQSRYLKKFV